MTIAAANFKACTGWEKWQEKIIREKDDYCTSGKELN